MPLRLSHVNLVIPEGGEAVARNFYGDLLGLPEIPKPAMLRARGGVWFDAGGIQIHLSVGAPTGPDAQRHVGLALDDIKPLEARLRAHGWTMDPGRPAPWPRFFVRDPFGNRLEIHDATGIG